MFRVKLLGSITFNNSINNNDCDRDEITSKLLMWETYSSEANPKVIEV